MFEFELLWFVMKQSNESVDVAISRCRRRVKLKPNRINIEMTHRTFRFGN